MGIKVEELEMELEMQNNFLDFNLEKKKVKYCRNTWEVRMTEMVLQFLQTYSIA